MAKLKARLGVVRTPKHRAVERVVLDGIISTPTIGRFRKIMDKALSAERDVILDMRGVTYVNSSGLAEFVRIHDALEQKNLCFIVVNLDLEVKRLIMMLGLRALLRVYPSAKKALESLDRGVLQSQNLDPGDTTRYFLQRGKAFVPVKTPPPPRLPEAKILLCMKKGDHFTRFLALCLAGNGGRTVIAETRDEVQQILGNGKIDIAIIDGAVDGYTDICADLKCNNKNGLMSAIVIYPRASGGPARDRMRICEDEYSVEPFEVREMIVTAESEFGRCRDESILFLQEAKLELPTTEQEIARACQVVERLLHDSGLKQDVTDGFFYAIREALDNARRHGNRQNKDKLIEMSYVLDKEKVSVTVVDQGKGFDFETVVNNARANSPIEQARTRQLNGEHGGLGIGLMLRCCDKVEYSPPGNTVRLIRYL